VEKGFWEEQHQYNLKLFNDFTSDLDKQPRYEYQYKQYVAPIISDRLFKKSQPE